MPCPATPGRALPRPARPRQAGPRRALPGPAASSSIGRQYIAVSALDEPLDIPLLLLGHALPAAVPAADAPILAILVWTRYHSKLIVLGAGNLMRASAHS